MTDARAQLPELLETQVRDGDVGDVGAVVPVDVAERLEELEDAYWSRRAADVLAKGQPTVPWDEAVALSESEDRREIYRDL